MPRPGPTLSTALLDAAVDLLGKSGQLGSVAVEGVSMHPTFRDVERLAVRFGETEAAVGDVLVFRQRGVLVVHRLVQRSRRSGGLRLRTRGDGTISFDPWVDPGSVIGRVVALGFPDGTWRSVRSARARLYGRLIAAHDLCWGGLGAAFVKYGGRTGSDWQWRLGRLDRFKLNLAHTLLFRAMHPRTPAPRFDGAPAPAGNAGLKARCYTRRFGPVRKRFTRLQP